MRPITLSFLPLLALLVGLTAAGHAAEKEIVPMSGGVLIDGYEYDKDGRPQGSIAYDERTNEFRGHYSGLKMPAGRRAIFAWLHDTVNQKTEYLGVVGWLQLGTVPTNPADFVVKAPPRFKGGKFGTNEIIGFTAEKTSRIAEDGSVAAAPVKPSGSAILPALQPAFYLYAKLPGADAERAFCGHGKDFFYAKDPARQTCYD
jgi:hypothetical protein